MFKNSGLTSIVYEADRIPDDCFKGASELETVVIANPLVYVGENAFANCSKLSSVVFNDNCGTEFIYKSAFANCNNLTKVDDYAFQNANISGHKFAPYTHSLPHDDCL